ncbi:unnamed protein product [Boreogadus saida]
MTPTSPYTPTNLLAIETLLQFKQVDCEFSLTDIRASPANRLTSRRGIKLWNCTIPLRFVTSRKVLSDLRHKLVTELGRKANRPASTCEDYEESTSLLKINVLIFSFEYRSKLQKCTRAADSRKIAKVRGPTFADDRESPRPTFGGPPDPGSRPGRLTGLQTGLHTTGAGYHVV